MAYRRKLGFDYKSDGLYTEGGKESEEGKESEGGGY